MAASVPLHVSGHSVTVGTDAPDMPSLYTLRDDLRLRRAAFRLRARVCGSCTFHVDGEAVRAWAAP